MTQVAGDRATTVVLPLPVELLGPLLGSAARRAGNASEPPVAS